jgi:hypothetical protein
MPSLKEIAGLITTFVVLSIASGNGAWVWKGSAYARFQALQQAHQGWGCPSIFGRNSCSKR